MILQQYVERAPEPLIGSGSKDPISQAISMSMDLDQDPGSGERKDLRMVFRENETAAILRQNQPRHQIRCSICQIEGFYALI